MATASKNPPKAAVKADPTAPIKAIKVISSQPGFRRAGRAFGPEAVTIPLSDLTEEELEAIQTEPKLVSVEVELPPEQPADSQDSDSKKNP